MSQPTSPAARADDKPTSPRAPAATRETRQTTQVRMALCQNGSVNLKAKESAIASALGAKDSVDPTRLVWIDVVGEPASALPQITQLIRLPHAILHGLGDPIERSRLLESAGIFAVVTHGLGFDTTTEEPRVSKMDIVFGQGFLITLHRTPYAWLDTLWSNQNKATGDENLMARGLPYLLHALLDTLVDTYFPVLDDIDDVIDQLEVSVINDTSNRVQQRLFHLKRAVATLRRVTLPQSEVMSSIIMRTGALIPAEVEPYFADIRDHTIRVYEMLDSYRDLLSGLLDVYLSTVSNRLNVVMKQLAIIATIFMPITFITGVFGQNFGVMPQVVSDHGLNFWIALSFMALVTGIQIWYFKRRGWL